MLCQRSKWQSHRSQISLRNPRTHIGTTSVVRDFLRAAFIACSAFRETSQARRFFRLRFAHRRRRLLRRFVRRFFYGSDGLLIGRDWDLGHTGTVNSDKERTRIEHRGTTPTIQCCASGSQRGLRCLVDNHRIGKAGYFLRIRTPANSATQELSSALRRASRSRPAALSGPAATRIPLPALH